MSMAMSVYECIWFDVVSCMVVVQLVYVSVHVDMCIGGVVVLVVGYWVVGMFVVVCVVVLVFLFVCCMFFCMFCFLLSLWACGFCLESYGVLVLFVGFKIAKIFWLGFRWDHF